MDIFGYIAIFGKKGKVRVDSSTLMCRTDPPMFSRKLLALGHPDVSATFSDDKSFRELIVWLESNHIQGLEESPRANLANATFENWSAIFNEYLAHINAPYSASDERNAIISWLLGRAVHRNYMVKSEELKTLTPENWEQATSTDNPLQNLDYESEAVVALSKYLSELLSLPPYGDHKEMLNAACILIVDRLKTVSATSPSSAAPKRTRTNPISASQASIPLSSTPLGFDTGDYLLNDLAKILRLQHINELRELQTLIDEAIVSVQKITANPKTDTKLGKHGF